MGADGNEAEGKGYGKGQLMATASSVDGYGKGQGAAKDKYDQAFKKIFPAYVPGNYIPRTPEDWEFKKY